MFKLLQSISDDQMALGVCLLTLASAAFFVFISFHVGRAGQRLRGGERKKSDLRIVPHMIAKSDQTQERAA